MQEQPVESGTVVRSPDTPSESGEEPQKRERVRSGILGEPAGLPPGGEESSERFERPDPIQEQAPQDGDHWRR